MLPRKQLVFNGFYCCSTHTNSETKHYFFFPASFRKLERHDTNEKKNCAQNIFHYVIFEHDAGGAKRAGVLNSQTTKQPNSQIELWHLIQSKYARALPEVLVLFYISSKR